MPVFQHEDRVALPVTDSQGMLIGIVTVDDVLDVAESAATRTLQRFGGMEALDEPYLQMRFLSMYRGAEGGSSSCSSGEMLTATAMSFFEREIERAVVLALFVPLIISSGGNSGSQAATLVIRALALGEVGLAEWWRVMFREIRAGLTLGVILGAIGFSRIAAWSAVSDIYGPHCDPGRAHGGAGPRRRRALGHARRLHAALRAAPPRLRPRGLVGAVRGDPGRRHRAHHLLQRGRR